MPDNTRSLLIESGEQLFAARGINGPSLREVTAASGVRNKSALQYHFGDRDGLVAAIVADHGERLRMRRVEAFEAAVIDDAVGDVARLCEVVVRPYCRFLGDSRRELAYLVIAAEVLADPSRPYEELRVLFNDALLPRIIDLLLGEIDLPAPLARERLVVAVSQVIAAVAVRARQALFATARQEEVALDIFIANLVDMMVASVSAPVSLTTQCALDAHSGTASLR